MAIDASDIFRAHAKDHRLSPLEARNVCAIARQTPTGAESKVIDQSRVPSVIVSASGMASGGRVLHHLKVFAPDHRNTILFTGFQAGGTRGAAMIAGAQTIKIFGDHIPVRAEVRTLDMLSHMPTPTRYWPGLDTLKNRRRPPSSPMASPMQPMRCASASRTR